MKKNQGNLMVDTIRRNIGVEMQLMFGNKVSPAKSSKSSNSCFGKSKKIGAADKLSDYRDKLQQTLTQKASLYTEERLIPDIVLVFPTKNANNNKSAAALLERVNFTISLIQTKFDCYMASDVSGNSCYLMIKMTQKELENECMYSDIKIKLLNAYGHELYDSTRKVDFEPFRSRQRQEITLISLKKLIDIPQLTDLKILKQIYTMHTVSGIDRIKEIWLNSKWYWPQPLISIKDYLKEGKHLNFSAITTLRMYFGEKFSFYFAWTSFYTSYLLLLAIPGLVITIFIRNDDSTSDYLLPIYVAYNSICSTLVVEKWKRKSTEIATRWGTIDMAHNTLSEKIMRNEFIGDEVPNQTTGTLTKENPKNSALLYFIISVPILFLLLAAVIATFLWTQAIEEDHPDMSSVEKILVSAVNGVAIAVLNYLYGTFAYFFVKKENHKYVHTYEKSLIFKVFLFRFLNSYIGLFYLIFVQGKNIDSLFYTLISLLATKQVSAVAMGCLVPWFKYKLQKKKYFEGLNNKGFEQWRLRKETSKQNLEDENHAQETKTKRDFDVKRPVLNCRNGTLETNQWALSRIELNSLRIRKDDFIEDYSQMLIQYGYITMFASLCPIGPIIGFIANIVDLRSKVFAFLYIHHRPPTEKAANIGIWHNIWEIMSIVGIAMNALILFFRSTSTIEWLEDGIMDSVYSESSSTNIRRLWLFIIAVHIILILKYIVSAFIPDKPQWVLEEEKKQNSMERLAIQNNKYDLKTPSRSHIDIQATQPVIPEQSNQSFQDNDNKHGDEPVEFDIPISPIRDDKKASSRQEKYLFESDSPKETRQQMKENSIETPRKVYHEAPKEVLPLASKALDLNHGIKSLFFNTFAYIEKELALKRLERLSGLITELVVKCDACKEEKSSLECIDCKEKYCINCLKEVHDKTIIKPHQIVSLCRTNSPESTRILNESTTGLAHPQEDQRNNKLNSLTKDINHKGENWRKIELFDFPTYQNGDSHFNLKKVFKALYQIYIADNGISPENTINNSEMALKFKKKDNKTNTLTPINNQDSQPEQDGEAGTNSGKISKGLDILLSKPCEIGEVNFLWLNELKKFADLSIFNTEEKLLINRVAFLIFKRRGAKTTYNDFYRQMKILEEGTFESKMILLFDIIDEDSDGKITLRDIAKVLNMSFFQNTEANDNYEDIVKTALQEYKIMDKRTLLTASLNSPEMKEILEVFLQTKK